MQKVLSQALAKSFDAALMGNKYAFDQMQLIELAGQACALACMKYTRLSSKLSNEANVLILVGAGNNGADGTVCARHLAHFGCSVDIWSPTYANVEKTPKHLQSLAQQCRMMALAITFIDSLPASFQHYCLVVDALFGFGYDHTRGLRAPFDDAIKRINDAKKVGEGDEETFQLACVDVVSGWSVDDGPSGTAEIEFSASSIDLLISLSAPKKFTERLHQRTTHVLGGRFVPPLLASEFNLQLPTFLDLETVTLIKMGE